MKKRIVFAIIFMIMILPLEGIKATEIVFNIIVPVPTHECWIIGNYNGWDLAGAKKCTPIDQTHYQVTLNDSTWNDSISISNLKYRYLSQNCDWTYVERGNDENYVKERTYRAGVNDTIAKWMDDSYEAFITFTVTTPKGTKHCYIYGNLLDQEVPLGTNELVETLVNSDSTVVFSTGLWSHSMCSNMSYRYSSGPTLEYDQLIPSANFGSSAINNVVLAWKATYTAITCLPVRTVSIYSNSSDIIIDGTEINERVNVYEINGVKIRTLKSAGEQIVISVPKNEIYFVTTPRKSVKLILK